MKKKRKRKQSKLTQMKNSLEQLRRDLAEADTQGRRAKVTLRILLLEQKVKREEFHRVSGFNQIRTSEIPSGAPGLGKR
ncbi:hypothetical protein [uncultured Marinobacter sp.]|uniref:hypothetical protein n=1 Tax=uncultured Marinobacter sp. TaxID=187379 RepID=UPI0030D73180